MLQILFLKFFKKNDEWLKNKSFKFSPSGDQHVMGRTKAIAKLSKYMSFCNGRRNKKEEKTLVNRKECKCTQ